MKIIIKLFFSSSLSNNLRQLSKSFRAIYFLSLIFILVSLTDFNKPSKKKGQKFQLLYFLYQYFLGFLA